MLITTPITFDGSRAPVMFQDADIATMLRNLDMEIAWLSKQPADYRVIRLDTSSWGHGVNHTARTVVFQGRTFNDLNAAANYIGSFGLVNMQLPEDLRGYDRTYGSFLGTAKQVQGDLVAIRGKLATMQAAASGQPAPPAPAAAHVGVSNRTKWIVGAVIGVAVVGTIGYFVARKR